VNNDKATSLPIALIASLLTLAGFIVSFPSGSHIESGLLIALLFLIWLWSDKNFTNPARVIEQICALAILAGCTMELMATFPSRRIMLIIMASVIFWFVCDLIKKNEYAAAWLVLTIGMTTAPFTELHLERNIWTLSSCLICMYHLLRSGHFFSSVSRRVQLSILLWSLLTILTFVSSYWSVYPYASLRFAGILIFLGFIFIQTVSIIRNTEMRKYLLKVLAGFAFVYVLAACKAFAIRAFSLGLRDALGFRIYVFDRHPNYTIFFLLLFLPLWMLVASKKKITARIYVAFGFLSSVTYLVFLSYSREGYLVLALFSAVLLLFISDQPLRKIIQIGFASGIVAITGAAIFSSAIRIRLVSILDVANSMRFQAWRVFADLIIDRPLLGYGIGTNRYIYPGALGFIRPGETATRQFLFEAHNAYIDILTGLGITGLVIFLLFLLSCTVPKHLPKSLESIVIFTLGAGIWIDFFFNFRLHAQDTGALIIVFLAFCLVINTEFKPALSKKHSINPKLLFLLATVLIFFCATPKLGKVWIEKAQSKLSGKNWPEIYQIFKKAAVCEPLNAHPHYFMALCDKQMQKQSAALNEFRTAVDLCPNYGFYRFQLATELVESGKTESAMKQLEAGKLLDLNDSDGRIRFNLAILEWRLGHREIAIQDFWAAILQNPTYFQDSYWKINPELHEKLLSDLENFSGAFISTDYLTPLRTQYYLNIISILLETRLKDYAERSLFATAWSNPGNLDIVITAITESIKLGDPDKAESLIINCIATGVEDSTLYNYLAYIYLINNNFNQAKYCLEKSETLWSEIAVDNFFNYQLLAEIAKKTNDKMLLKKMEPKIKYLSNERYSRQLGDLSIHIGSSSHLVNAPKLVQ